LPRRRSTNCGDMATMTCTRPDRNQEMSALDHIPPPEKPASILGQVGRCSPPTSDAPVHTSSTQCRPRPASCFGSPARQTRSRARSRLQPSCRAVAALLGRSGSCVAIQQRRARRLEVLRFAWYKKVGISRFEHNPRMSSVDPWIRASVDPWIRAVDPWQQFFDSGIL